MVTKKSSEKGNSPIHYAASNGHLQVLDFLTSYGTDLMIPNENGKTPLQLAKSNGYSKIVKYLVECERKQNEDQKRK